MSNEIRGGEVLLRFSIDGVLQSSSWTRCTDFTLTPKQELQELDIIGEDETDYDLRHDGFEFSGTLLESEPSVRAYLAQVVANHEAHAAPPNVTMFVRWGFRAGNNAVQETFRKAKMKLDESTFDRKDFVKTKFSGRARKYSSKIAP